MKKRVFIVLGVLLILIGGYAYFRYRKNLNDTQKRMARYEEIRRDVDKEMKRYWYLVMPTCTTDYTVQQGVSDGQLIYNGGMDKEKFLDVDGESYCDTYTYATCIYKNVWEFETHIRCKDYEDEKFQDWDKPRCYAPECNSTD